MLVSIRVSIGITSPYKFYKYGWKFFRHILHKKWKLLWLQSWGEFLHINLLSFLRFWTWSIERFWFWSILIAVTRKTSNCTHSLIIIKLSFNLSKTTVCRQANSEKRHMQSLSVNGPHTTWSLFIVEAFRGVRFYQCRKLIAHIIFRVNVSR